MRYAVRCVFLRTTPFPKSGGNWSSRRVARNAWSAPWKNCIPACCVRGIPSSFVACHGFWAGRFYPLPCRPGSRPVAGSGPAVRCLTAYDLTKLQSVYNSASVAVASVRHRPGIFPSEAHRFQTLNRRRQSRGHASGMQQANSGRNPPVRNIHPAPGVAVPLLAQAGPPSPPATGGCLLSSFVSESNGLFSAPKNVGYGTDRFRSFTTHQSSA